MARAQGVEPNACVEVTQVGHVGGIALQADLPWELAALVRTRGSRRPMAGKLLAICTVTGVVTAPNVFQVPAFLSGVIAPVLVCP